MVYGIIGYPVGHSLSPVIHNLVFERLHLDACYVPFPVRREQDLHGVVRALSLAGVSGLNITIPHKVAAAQLCDELSPEASACGASNTLVLREGRLCGHNTDVAGFLAPLSGVPLEGRSGLLLGAGGAARAAGYALARAGVIVTVAARERDRALEVAGALEAATNARVSTIPWDERSIAARGSNLIVNATPVGQEPGPRSSPLELAGSPGTGQLAYDLVYNPEETRFLEDARAAGARTIGGLVMLIHQALAAIELWVGLRVDREIEAELLAACRAEMARRRGAWAG